jgi:formate-dependent nitrite reductase membrane component NrfD
MVACWNVRGGRLPRGAVLGISVVACLAVARSIHAHHPVNIVDAAIALVTGGLLLRSFLAAGFFSSEADSRD